MMAFLRNLLPFLDRRSSSRFSRLGNRTSALAHRVGTKRNGGIALGTLFSLAAPFVIRRLMARRRQRNMQQTAPAY